MEKNLFFTILTGCSCVFGVENAVEVTNLREFFYADYLISEHKNLDFRVHSPIEQAAFPAQTVSGGTISPVTLHHFMIPCRIIRQLNASRSFSGDKIAFVPQWRDKKFSELPPGKFRLCMRLKECDIYSISFK